MANFQDITGIKIAQAAMTTEYTVIYTSPTDTRTYVKDITVVNTTSTSKNIYVNLVPSAVTTDASNAIFYNTPLPANTTVQWCGIQILNPADTVEVKASDTGCTVSVSGGEAV